MRTRTEIEAAYRDALTEGDAVLACGLLQTHYFLTPPPFNQFVQLLAAARRRSPTFAESVELACRPAYRRASARKGLADAIALGLETAVVK